MIGNMIWTRSLKVAIVSTLHCAMGFFESMIIDNYSYILKKLLFHYELPEKEAEKAFLIVHISTSFGSLMPIELENQPSIPLYYEKKVP